MVRIDKNVAIIRRCRWARIAVTASFLALVRIVSLVVAVAAVAPAAIAAAITIQSLSGKVT